MTVLSKAALQSAATTITTETVSGANTAARVGGLHRDTIDSLLHAESPVLAGPATPAQITSNQNNYATTSGWNRLASDAARTITGLAGGANGAVLIVENIGSFAIKFTAQDAASTAANRLDLVADLEVPSGTLCVFLYDGTLSRWRLFISPRSVLELLIAEQASLGTPSAAFGKYGVLSAATGTIQRPAFVNKDGTARVLSPFPTDIDAARQTTDGTLTTALTLAVPDNTILSIGIRWKARQTGGSANYLIKNSTIEVARVNAGAAAIVTGSLKVGTDLLPAGWTGGSVAVSGNNALIQIQGVAATTINWTTQAWVTSEAMP